MLRGKTSIWMIVFCSVCTWAATGTWTGSVSSDFTDPNNWSPTVDVTDDEGDVLTIGASLGSDPIYNHTLSTRPNGLTVTEDGSFTLYGGELYTYGNNTLNGTTTIKNGLLSMRGYVYLGNGAAGELIIDGGTFESKYTLYIGRYSGGEGTLRVLEGVVHFPYRPSISSSGGSGGIYIEEGGFCYISGDDTAWFQSLADSGTITTDEDSVIVVTYQSVMDRTCITAEKITGASLPVPWNGTEQTDMTTLAWQAGTLATTSRVYLGTDAETVANATTSDSQYLGTASGESMTIPTTLTEDVTYYWRVDTVADTGLIRGDVWSFTPVAEIKPRRMENLDRGLIALGTDSGNYVGWRLFGTDPEDISFNIYRGTTKINTSPVTDSTNYLDTDGSDTDVYTVCPVIDGQEQDASKVAVVQPIQGDQPIPFYTLSLQQVPGDTDWSYTANDAAVGDLDCDGDYELIIKRYSADDDEYPIVEAYQFDGTFLWRINLGPNHLSTVEIDPIVYDLDGDGFAEVALRTCEGMTDGQGNTTGDTNGDGIIDYRGFGYAGDGYIDAGPEFLSIFDGLTGEELARTDYIPRVALSQWGDNYGHRANKFHMVIAYLDGHQPSLVICRGIYALTKLEGWNYRNGTLEKLWHFTSEEWSGFDSQGNHNLSVADVDSDGRDEIIYGGMCVDHDGSGLYTTGQGHGDAIHVSDMDPNRPGLEVWRCVETTATGASLTDAATGEVIIDHYNTADIGRCGAAHIDSRYPGYQIWSYAATGTYTIDGTQISENYPNMNFFVWWTDDLQRELLDAVGSAGVNTILNKWNGDGVDRYLSLYNIPDSYGTCSNNGTKANPCLSGDLFGDWREEIVLRSADNKKIRIFSTTELTSYRIYTLMHDPQYRLAMAWQCCAYNQPPHPGFYIGEGMDTPPVPNITLIEADPDETAAPSPNPMGWAVRPYQNGNNTIAMQAMAAVDQSGVQYYFTCTHGNGHDSGWQASPSYEDAGLAEGAVYTYTVTVRDQSNNLNTTMTSVPASCQIPNLSSVVEAWDFEDGTAGLPLSEMTYSGTTGTVSGIVLYGYDETAGPSFAAVTSSADGLSAYCDGLQDGYTVDASLNTWTPEAWTIEVTARLDDISEWETIIGRDGSTNGDLEADFYLQRNDDSSADVQGAFRINYETTTGQRWVLDSDFAVESGRWYRLAITSDGAILTMYCDKFDGDGYQVVGTLDISSQTPAENVLASGQFNWTFGRGWYSSLGYTNHIIGYLDNIRFSDAVLSPDQFLGSCIPSIDWLYGDFTGDHRVDLDDFAVFSRLWLWEDQETLTDFDIDEDGIIEMAEFAEMANNWLISD